MELPFLKNKKQDGGGGSAIERKASTKDDGMDDSEMMGHVWDELVSAFEKKDRKLGMDALTALVLYIQDQDKKQDQEMTS